MSLFNYTIIVIRYIFQYIYHKSKITFSKIVCKNRINNNKAILVSNNSYLYNRKKKENGLYYTFIINEILSYIYLKSFF